MLPYLTERFFGLFQVKKFQVKNINIYPKVFEITKFKRVIICLFERNTV